MTSAEYILLNGRRFFSEEIARISKELKNKSDIPGWERELFLFLDEWFAESDFVLAQTSGSTGTPKLIELSKAMMRKSAARTIDYFGLKKDDRCLLCLPCRFIAGKMMVVRAIVGQMELTTVDPSGDFDFLRDQSFDFAAMVPNQLSKILERVAGEKELQNIRNLLLGGSSISNSLGQQLGKLSNRIVLSYGMTETASHIAVRELSGVHKSNWYHCLRGITVAINEAACLQINLPELGEILQTNDIAKLQSETSFQILGRYDSVLISGGIKYSPETIEKKIETLIDRRFVVSSVPDEKLGEKLVLVIEGNVFDLEELRKSFSDYLSGYERPKAVLFLEHFPETSNGKIKRNEIKEMICQRL